MSRPRASGSIDVNWIPIPSPGTEVRTTALPDDFITTNQSVEVTAHQALLDVALVIGDIKVGTVVGYHATGLFRT